jgi:hypothetical protein
VEKLEYSKIKVLRAVNFWSIRMDLNGNDVFSDHYMKEKNDYEENFRKWEELKSEITRKKWIRKEIFKGKSLEPSPPMKDNEQKSQNEIKAQETMKHLKNEDKTQREIESVNNQLQMKHEEQETKTVTRQEKMKTNQITTAREETNENVINENFRKKKNTNQYQFTKNEYLELPQDLRKDVGEATIKDEGNNLSADDIINLQKNNILWKDENKYEIYEEENDNAEVANKFVEFSRGINRVNVITNEKRKSPNENEKESPLN